MQQARTSVWLMMVYGLFSTGYVSETHDITNGILTLNLLLEQRDFSTYCPYIKCQLPTAKEECPEGTRYTEGTAQFGCCAACVSFKQYGDVNCTGSVSEGYTLDNITDPPDSIIEPGFEPMTNILNSQWCDYGLQCNENSTCVRNMMDAPCKHMQEMFDMAITEGTYVPYRDDYRWRPHCTPEGDFAEKQCKGPQGEQRCVCVDPMGNTIYGKAFPEQTELFGNMNCKCSRKIWERMQAGETSITLHCQENGNYEPLQCDGGLCYCTDPETGIPYQPFFPESERRRLSCFNGSQVGAQYLRRCESEYHAHMVLMEDMEEHGTIGPETMLKCDPDGSYSGEQLEENNNLLYCYDKYKEIRNPYGLSNGGCNCVRDKWLFEDFGIHFPYKCAPSSGTYAEKQVEVNKAFCLNADGIRSGPIVYAEYVDLLNCANAHLCQAGDEGSSCEEVCLKEDMTPCDPEYFFKYNLNISNKRHSGIL